MNRGCSRRLFSKYRRTISTPQAVSPISVSATAGTVCSLDLRPGIPARLYAAARCLSRNQASLTSLHEHAAPSHKVVDLYKDVSSDHVLHHARLPDDSRFEDIDSLSRMKMCMACEQRDDLESWYSNTSRRITCICPA